MIQLLPKKGETIKWYQYPFALVYGLWELLVQGKSVD